MSKIYMQFSNCIAVKGYNRSVLYDIQRTRYLFVENEFANLLITNKNKIHMTKENNEYEQLLQKLVDDEWGIYLDEDISSNFPELNLQWKHHAKITNAQIDINSAKIDFHFFFQNVLPQFEDLGCKLFQINFLEKIEYKELGVATFVWTLS